MNLEYPLDFTEIAGAIRHKADRKLLRLTGAPALGERKISILFDATGKKWVRFTVWDAADNGAWAQPIMLHRGLEPASLGSGRPALR